LQPSGKSAASSREKTKTVLGLAAGFSSAVFHRRLLEGAYMQSMKYFVAVVAVCLVASASSFAKSKNSGPLNIADNHVNIGSTQLAPGDYTVQWTGQPNHVQVNVLKGKKIVASTQGKIVTQAKASDENAVVIKTLKNNTKTVAEVDFNNRKEALVITPAAPKM
jgi:hypothetical protein